MFVLQKCKVAAITSAQNLSKQIVFSQFSTDCKDPSLGKSTLEKSNHVDISAVKTPLLAPLKKPSRTPAKRILWTSPTPIVRGEKGLNENSDATTDKADVTLDDKSPAERAWLDSGYIEYMDNQRDKGWKT